MKCTATRAGALANVTLGALLALTALPATARAADLHVSQAWSRPALATGVVYATIANSGAHADRLDRVTSDVAKAVELHRSMTMNAMSGMPDTGVMSMTPVAALDIPSRGTLRFAPGGNHVMLIGLRAPLHAGQTFAVRFHFVRAGWIGARVAVRAI